jgi:predicted O-methyltransferase YrrM
MVKREIDKTAEYLEIGDFIGLVLCALLKDYKPMAKFIPFELREDDAATAQKNFNNSRSHTKKI